MSGRSSTRDETSDCARVRSITGKRAKTVSLVVENELCIGCGTCAAICPNEAIKMEICSPKGLILPRIDEDQCSTCGACIESCPGFSVDLEELKSEIFGKQADDVLLGNFLKCYIGHSNNQNIRYASASGGMVTQLLIFALEKGLIEGALVARMSKTHPLRSEPFIAKTKQEILDASKSKYCPVSSVEVLREMMKLNGRFAVVGLPCHVYGFRMAERRIKKLRNKIVLHVGLLCFHTCNFLGTESLLQRFGLKEEDVRGIDYRGRGWPGEMSIWLKNGKCINIPFLGTWNAYWNLFSSFLFTPMRCLMCPDECAELADISIGDAWLPELKTDTIGRSVIITRSKEAEKILREMHSENIVSLRNIDPSKVKQSQGFSLNFKKKGLSCRLSLLRSLGYAIPHIEPKPEEGRGLSFFSALLTYMSLQISRRRPFRILIKYIPLPLLRLYWGLFVLCYKLSRNRS